MEKSGFFVSSQDSDGYGDIMKIKMSEDIEEDTVTIDEVVAVEEIIKEVPITTILKIVDASTYESISANLIISTNTLSSANGIFEIDSLIGKEIELKSQGFPS